MSSVLKTVKFFLLKSAHAKTESNSKTEKVNILNMIRAVLEDVLLVGLEWNITMLQGRNLSETKGRHIFKYVNIDIEKYREKDKQHHENKKTKYKNTRNIDR